MAQFRFSRRLLVQAGAAISAAFALPDITEAEEARRRFWFLDRRHVGLREFYHIYGNLGERINLTDVNGNKPGFEGDVSLDAKGWIDLGWEVEQVTTGDDRLLYRARLVHGDLIHPEYPSKPLDRFYGIIQPDYSKVSPWMSPNEAEEKHGIIIKRG